ncbi:hypothetical protein BDP27DRAFT_801141 [Rhodocollybia butyracea]|uniref:Uncharacterized protein n=1 Tax=Rhodocollybia butyracea TaxID=206335 RepID=A0A9P5UER7_9AGAR|nr:hypothetical protein BDP27DRAFT_801141 [Rhodocollybia butyracea]
MALVDRKHSIMLFSPTKLSRSHRRSSSSSSSSSGPSTYSFISASQETLPTPFEPLTPASPITVLGPSKTRNSCLSEFCCDCADYRCSLSRRMHIRRPNTTRLLPPRPLPRPPPTTVVKPRKLPSVPSAPTAKQPRAPRSPNTNKLVQEYKSYFTPEIDWDVIMVEIVRRGGSDKAASSDADSIYTDFTDD